MVLINNEFGTEPMLFQAQGNSRYVPVWPELKEWCFSLPVMEYGASGRVTVITCNNGHPAMGLFEMSAERLGIPVMVVGQQYSEWINAEHKPRSILQALEKIKTPYVLYADSRDAIIAGNPDRLVDRLENQFDAEMIFGAARLPWPNTKDLNDFEISLSGAEESNMRHLNGGLWIGKRDIAYSFFTDVLNTHPHEKAPDSEQGKLRKVFPNYYPRISLDYRCEIFQNVGFIFKKFNDIYTVQKP